MKILSFFLYSKKFVFGLISLLLGLLGLVWALFVSSPYWVAFCLAIVLGLVLCYLGYKELMEDAWK